MGFQHSIAGGQGNLIATSLQSPDFSSGSTGWQVRKDGSVEFNNGTFRGTISGGTLIISQGTGATFEQIEIDGATGITTWSKYKSPTVVIRQILANGTDLVYADPGSGGAQGALVRSDSPVAGTDQFGNPYPEGILVGPSGVPQVRLDPAASDSGAPLAEIVFKLPATFPNHPNIYGQTSGSGGFMSVNGPVDSTQGDQAYLTLLSAAAFGNGSAFGIPSYKDTAGTVHDMAWWTYSGLTIPAGTIAAVKPGTGTSPSNVAQGEGWHDMVLINGWTPQGTGSPHRYRLLPDGNVQVECQINGSASSSGVFWNVPAGYAPSSGHFLVAFGTSGNIAALVQVSLSGSTWQMLLALPAWSSGAKPQQIIFNGLFPLN